MNQPKVSALLFSSLGNSRHFRMFVSETATDLIYINHLLLITVPHQVIFKIKVIGPPGASSLLYCMVSVLG